MNVSNTFPLCVRCNRQILGDVYWINGLPHHPFADCPAVAAAFPATSAGPWICPRCQTVNAPNSPRCNCRPTSGGSNRS